MALDRDEVDDDDVRDMICIPPSLWINADYRLFTCRLPSVQGIRYPSSVTFLHVLRDAPMHRHTARAQRVQIAPYASFVATTLATIDAVLVVSHGRVPTCRC